MTDNLQKLISEAVVTRMTPKVIEAQVNKRVDEMVKSAINDALSPYGETGKLLTTAVKTALRVNKLDLPEYGHTVTAILKTQIEAQVSKLVAGKLTEDMSELLSIAPKTIKLSKIVQMMKEGHCDYEDSYGDGQLVTCIVERDPYSHGDGEHVWIYLDEHVEENKNRCGIQMCMSDDNTISGASLSGQDMKTTTHLGRSYGTAQLIRAYYACGTIIEIDEDEVDTRGRDYN